MKGLATILCLRGVLSGVVLGAGSSLSKKEAEDREKGRPFECGFTVKDLPRLPISLRFFLVSVVFLIFDVELVLLFPAAVRGLQSGGLVGSVVLLVFVLVLLGGLGHEINQGSLGWAR